MVGRKKFEYTVTFQTIIQAADGKMVREKVVCTGYSYVIGDMGMLHIRTVDGDLIVAGGSWLFIQSRPAV